MGHEWMRREKFCVSASHLGTNRRVECQPINSPLFSAFLCQSSFLPRASFLPSLPMARTTEDSHLWKQTPATNMTKAQLLELANAKDARVLYLCRKNSKCRMCTIDL